LRNGGRDRDYGGEEGDNQQRDVPFDRPRWNSFGLSNVPTSECWPSTPQSDC